MGRAWLTKTAKTFPHWLFTFAKAQTPRQWGTWTTWELYVEERKNAFRDKRRSLRQLQPIHTAGGRTEGLGRATIARISLARLVQRKLIRPTFTIYIRIGHRRNYTENRKFEYSEEV